MKEYQFSKQLNLAIEFHSSEHINLMKEYPFSKHIYHVMEYPFSKHNHPNYFISKIRQLQEYHFFLQNFGTKKSK